MSNRRRPGALPGGLRHSHRRVGIDPRDKRTILGVNAALSEAVVHGRQLLAGPQQRRLPGVTFIVSDDHADLSAARTAIFPAVPSDLWAFSHQLRRFDDLLSASSMVDKLPARGAKSDITQIRLSSLIDISPHFDTHVHECHFVGVIVLSETPCNLRSGMLRRC